MYPGAVVHELRHRTSSDWANVVGLVSHRVQRGLYPVEDLAVAADPDREFAGPSALRASADGGVHDVDAARCQLRVNLADHFGRAGAEVQIDLALGQALVQSVLAERDRFYLHRTRKRREYYLGLLRHLAGRVGPLRSHLQMRRRGLAANVVDDQIVAAPNRVERDRATHHTQSNESYFHKGHSFCISCRSASIHAAYSSATDWKRSFGSSSHALSITSSCLSVPKNGSLSSEPSDISTDAVRPIVKTVVRSSIVAPSSLRLVVRNLCYADVGIVFSRPGDRGCPVGSSVMSNSAP